MVDVNYPDRSCRSGFDNCCQIFYDAQTRSQNTLSFALPPSMRTYINTRVTTGHYGNTSEYIRDLVRKDQADNAKAHLQTLIAEGLASGPGTPWSASDRAEMVAVANGDVE